MPPNKWKIPIFVVVTSVTQMMEVSTFLFNTFPVPFILRTLEHTLKYHFPEHQYIQKKSTKPVCFNE